MLINELLAQKILEFGPTGFPGYGRGLFRQVYYQYMVPEINKISDQAAREWLIDWLANLFHRDNPKFNERLFKQAIATKRIYNVAPVFQQRHFFYLAQAVKEIQDPHVHDFVEHWLAQVAGSTNSNFKASVWAKYCAHDRPAQPAVPPPVETEIDEGPTYGHRGHGGFGQKFFSKAQYQFIAWQLHDISDPTVREHLTVWFGKAFKLDNPAFDFKTFAQAVMSQPSYRAYPPRVQFQQRHFYYLAHEVADITDPHERKFVCDWLATKIGRTNEHFNPERWEEYCHLDANSYERQAVQHTRAKAAGDKDVPPDPYEAIRRRHQEEHPEWYPQGDEPAAN